MEFIKKLKERSDYRLAVKLPEDRLRVTRLFNPIIINQELKLSVQAGYGMYCYPQVTLEDLSQYKSMEMAILGDGNNFLRARHVAPTFPKVHKLEEYHGSGVYARVPVELIEDFYQYLKFRKPETFFERGVNLFKNILK